MKISNLLIIILITSTLAFTTGSNSDRVHDKLSSKNEVFSMSLSKNITDFFDMDVDFNGTEKWITGDFDKGKLLIVENIGDEQVIKSIFLKENYTEVEMEEEVDSDKAVFLFVDRKGNSVSEAHFVVVGEENTVVITVFGDIKVKNKK